MFDKFVTQVCQFCSRDFSVKKSLLKKGEGKYCSLSCAVSATNSLRPVGKSKTATRRRARKVYTEKTGIGNPRCSNPMCGSPDADIHHDDEDPTNNDIENLIPLCRPCHTKLENERRRRKKRAA